MNQVLRLLESEQEELQAKIERLQGDRELGSSDTQLLQGTLILGHVWLSELRERKPAGEKGFSICLVGSVISFYLEGKAGLF